MESYLVIAVCALINVNNPNTSLDGELTAYLISIVITCLSVACPAFVLFLIYAGFIRKDKLIEEEKIKTLIDDLDLSS